MENEIEEAEETEESPEQEETPSQKLGLWIAIIPVLFFSNEAAPGWGFLNLNWDLWVFLTIVGVCGCIGGALHAKEAPWAGLIGGAVMAMGALGATQAYLHMTTSTHTFVLVLIGLVGAIPGAGVYYLAKNVLYRE